MCSDNQINENDLIKAADEQLYLAKEKGKDQLAYQDYQMTEDRNNIKNISS